MTSGGTCHILARPLLEEVVGPDQVVVGEVNSVAAEEVRPAVGALAAAAVLFLAFPDQLLTAPQCKSPLKKMQIEDVCAF